MTASTFQPFDLEHYQSQFENDVEINLADSSVKCATLSEWLTQEEQQELLNIGLFYPQVNGTMLLRQRIAALYPNATPDNILVTVGASQANKMVCETLLEPDDEVIVVSPGYRQVWGMAKNLGCKVKELHLQVDDKWRLNTDNLRSLISNKTKLVSIVNPNNPTGTVLSSAEMKEIIDCCARVNCWLLADEVYAGTELTMPTETFWQKYPKLICTNSLSKAYRLAGLRIGWVVASEDMIQSLWRRHEYAVIAASAPSMKVAEFALQPDKRQQLLASQRLLNKHGSEVFDQWIKQHSSQFSVNPVAATSVRFVKYHADISSYDVAEMIRTKFSVLVAPGSTLGQENHLRITIGYEPAKVFEALRRISQALALA